MTKRTGRGSGSEKRRATVQLKLRSRPGRRPPQAGRHPRPVPVRPHPQCPAKDSPPPLPPPAVDEAHAAILVQIASARDVLKSSVAGLGRSGSNLNQITHVLNTDRSPESVMNILRDTLESHFEALAGA